MKTFPIRSTTFLFVWPTNCTMPRIRREIRQVVDCFLSFPENLFFVLLIFCFLLLYSWHGESNRQVRLDFSGWWLPLHLFKTPVLFIKTKFPASFTLTCGVWLECISSQNVDQEKSFILLTSACLLPRGNFEIIPFPQPESRRIENHIATDAVHRPHLQSGIRKENKKTLAWLLAPTTWTSASPNSSCLHTQSNTRQNKYLTFDLISF